MRYRRRSSSLWSDDEYRRMMLSMRGRGGKGVSVMTVIVSMRRRLLCSGDLNCCLCFELVYRKRNTRVDAEYSQPRVHLAIIRRAAWTWQPGRTSKVDVGASVLRRERRCSLFFHKDADQSSFTSAPANWDALRDMHHRLSHR